MKLNFVILAQGVSLDHRTHIMSIINVIEGYKSKEFPVVFQNITLVVSLRRDKSDPLKGKIELNIVSNKSNLKKELDFNFNHNEFLKPASIKEELSHKMFLNIPKMEIKDPGIISFKIKYMKRTIGTYEMSVSKDQSSGKSSGIHKK